MKQKNKLKNNRGITLIALIITIVVMLILAGVTINLTLGQNGIFTTAQKAAQNYVDAENKELAQLSDFTEGLTAGKIVRTENGVQYIGDGAGNLIPVPVGFSYLEGTKSTGFIIKNDTDENEFVWIPIGSMENYRRVGWTKTNWEFSQTLNEKTGEITRADKGTDYVWTETMPQDEYDSVSTYGGFYIGRYESGIENGILTSESNDSITDETQKQNWTGYTGDNIKLVVQNNKQVWNFITRDKAKNVAEELYSKATNNVYSKLCSSYAWDSTLKFMQIQNDVYITNSTGGNYDKSTGGTGKIQKTGYHGVNNIYDMGGNASEWTTESYSVTTAPCVRRGGTCFNSAESYPVADRRSSSNTHATSSISFRVALYI